MAEPGPAQVPKCRRCGDAHEIFACPHVKAVDLAHPGDLGAISRVEFLTPADFVAQRAPPAAGREPDYPRKGTA